MENGEIFFLEKFVSCRPITSMFNEEYNSKRVICFAGLVKDRTLCVAKESDGRELVLIDGGCAASASKSVVTVFIFI